MASGEFQSDCARCAALCCVVLAFDSSEHFGCDKPALEACPKLRRDCCSIHGELAQRGFSGCASYECYGAGPRVLHELCDGDAALARSLASAFSVMREVQELRFLLEVAGRLPLASDERARLGLLRSALAPAPGWSLASLATFERGSLASDVAAFLRSLRGHVSRRRLPLVAESAPR